MYPMKCSVTPMMAAAMLERQAGRPLSASELYTGHVSPHGTYDYGTVQQMPAVWTLNRRYGFNVNGRRTVGQTHWGGFVGSAFTQAAIWAIIGAVLMPFLMKWMRKRGMDPFAKRANPAMTGAIAGASIGVINTLLAQFLHRPLVQAQQPAAAQTQQQKTQQNAGA